MKNVVIVDAVRTPIGRARKGSLAGVDAFELARVVVAAMLERTKVEPAEIDDLIIAESMQGGGVIARYTAAALGLSDLPGAATNRHCAAGLNAVAMGAASIAAGMDRVVLTGGTESMSTMPMCQKAPAAGAAPAMWMPASHPETPDAPAFDMSITVGHNTAVAAGLSRAARSMNGLSTVTAAPSRASIPVRSTRRSRPSRSLVRTARSITSRPTSIRAAA